MRRKGASPLGPPICGDLCRGYCPYWGFKGALPPFWDLWGSNPRANVALGLKSNSLTTRTKSLLYIFILPFLFAIHCHLLSSAYDVCALPFAVHCLRCMCVCCICHQFAVHCLRCMCVCCLPYLHYSICHLLPTKKIKKRKKKKEKNKLVSL